MYSEATISYSKSCHLHEMKITTFKHIQPDMCYIIFRKRNSIIISQFNLFFTIPACNNVRRKEIIHNLIKISFFIYL